jgi:hypothetical protein
LFRFKIVQFQNLKLFTFKIVQNLNVAGNPNLKKPRKNRPIETEKTKKIQLAENRKPKDQGESTDSPFKKALIGGEK